MELIVGHQGRSYCWPNKTFLHVWGWRMKPSCLQGMPRWWKTKTAQCTNIKTISSELRYMPLWFLQAWMFCCHKKWRPWVMHPVDDLSTEANQQQNDFNRRKCTFWSDCCANLICNYTKCLVEAIAAKGGLNQPVIKSKGSHTFFHPELWVFTCYAQ